MPFYEITATVTYRLKADSAKEAEAIVSEGKATVWNLDLETETLESHFCSYCSHEYMELVDLIDHRNETGHG